MQKKCLLGTPALALVFIVLSGCATTYHYDKETLPEQQAILKIVGPYQIIVALDEVGVKWKSAGMMASLVHNTVYMPAGPHTLTVNYKEGSGLMAFYGHGTQKRADAMHVSQNFLPGHTYNITLNIAGSRVTPVITDMGVQGGAK